MIVHLYVLMLAFGRLGPEQGFEGDLKLTGSLATGSLRVRVRVLRVYDAATGREHRVRSVFGGAVCGSRQLERQSERPEMDET